MIPPNTSLLKYDNPVLVSRNTEKRTPKVCLINCSFVTVIVYVGCKDNFFIYFLYSFLVQLFVSNYL